jgi:hypothetical protein
VDLTPWVTPGQTASLDYVIQSYENLCRPDNPSCIPHQTCDDCNYNSTGHTEPIWSFQTQLIYYRRIDPATVAGTDGAILPGITLDQNSPNPFHPLTWIRYTIPSAGSVQLSIFDASGRIVRRIQREHAVPGFQRMLWDGRDEAGGRLPAGVYFCRIAGPGGATGGRRMLLLP